MSPFRWRNDGCPHFDFEIMDVPISRADQQPGGGPTIAGILVFAETGDGMSAVGSQLSRLRRDAVRRCRSHLPGSTALRARHLRGVHPRCAELRRSEPVSSETTTASASATCTGLQQQCRREGVASRGRSTGVRGIGDLTRCCRLQIWKPAGATRGCSR